MLIDTHAHLTDSVYENIDEIIKDFKNHNIQYAFTVGYNMQSSIDAVKLAEKYNEVYAIIGIHPNDIHELNEQTLEQLKSLASHKKVIAIGEIGLDYHYGTDNIEKQKQGFLKQLNLAHALNLPIILHVRDAYNDMINLLKENKHLLTNGGVFHCYGEDITTFNTIKDEFGFYVSIGGAVTFKNASLLQQTIKDIPLSSIMLETDCPYLTPVPYRGKEVNQPKYLSLVAQKIAELKNIDVNEVQQITTNNVYKLFKKIN